jgi:hypothetical protein
MEIELGESSNSMVDFPATFDDRGWIPSMWGPPVASLCMILMNKMVASTPSTIKLPHKYYSYK